MSKGILQSILVFLALVMWALSFPSLKVTLEVVDPLTLAAIRFIIPIPIIYIFHQYEKSERTGSINLGKKRKSDNPTSPDENSTSSNRHTRSLIFAFGLFNVVLPNILQNYGMQSTSSGVTSIIQGSGPVFAILFAVMFLKEELTRPQIIGITIAFVGSILLVTEGRPELDGSTVGKLLILLSAVSYSISGVIAKILLRDFGAGDITLKSFIIGGIILLTAAFILEEPLKLGELGIVYWQHILFISLFPTCFAYILWYRAMRLFPLSRLAISIFLIPVMAVVFSFFFLGETIGIYTVSTGSMVIIGVLIAQYFVKKDGRLGSISGLTKVVP